MGYSLDDIRSYKTNLSLKEYEIGSRYGHRRKRTAADFSITLFPEARVFRLLERDSSGLAMVCEDSYSRLFRKASIRSRLHRALGRGFPQPLINEIVDIYIR